MKTDTRNRLDIDRIAFLGRTFAEYRDMFGLSDELLGAGRILDCPGGASSFTQEASRRGFDATACDILYNLSAIELYEKGMGDISYVFEKFDDVNHLYVWDYYGSKEEVMALRRKALNLFLEDFWSRSSEERYLHAALPQLPFPDRTFSLVLSAHFLFLYNDRLDVDFHKTCLRELMRVCNGELRIFPLVGLDAAPYRCMDEILSFLDTEGIEAEIIRVPFQFQLGADRMLKLTRGKLSGGLA